MSVKLALAHYPSVINLVSNIFYEFTTFSMSFQNLLISDFYYTSETNMSVLYLRSTGTKMAQG